VAVGPQARQGAVELPAQQDGGEDDIEVPGADELAGRPHGEALLALDAHGVEGDRPEGVGLGRHQQPLVGLGQAQLGGAGGLGRLGRRLATLGLVEVELAVARILVDGPPGEMVGHPPDELVEATAVGRQEHHHVAVVPGGGAAPLEDLARRGHGRGVGGLGQVGLVGVEQHQARLGGVGHVARFAGRGVDAGEGASLFALLGEQTGDERGDVIAALGQEPFGPVPGKAGHRRRQRIPVAAGIGVEVGGPPRQAGHGVADGGDGLAGQHAGEAHPGGVEAPVGGVDPGGGAQEHRAGHPAGGLVAPEGAGELAVQRHRQRVGTVDVGVEDRLPGVLQVAGQLRGDRGVSQGDAGGHDQGGLVAALPQGVDDPGHEPQHPPGALEALQGGPVLVEAGEQLGVDRERRLDPLDVGGLAALGGELRALPAVQVAEGPGRRVPGGQGLGLHGPEQPAPDDLEALRGAGRPPRRLHPAHHGAQAGQGLPAAGAAHLHVRAHPAGRRRLGARRLRRGQGHDDHGPRHARAASVRAWAKLNWVSKVPAARSSAPTSWRA